jgi:serine/threonine protein kinase
MSETMGPQADIWALGMIAYELLTGKAYWETENLAALLLKVVQGNLKPPSEQAPGLLPPAFDGWFLRSCARDPKARFPSVMEQMTALAAALGLPPAQADAEAAPAALQELFDGQPSSAPRKEPPAMGPMRDPPSQPDRAPASPQVSARAEQRAPESPGPRSPEERSQPHRRIVPLLGALLVLVLSALVFSVLALRRPAERAAQPSADMTTAPPAIAIPKAAPPPTEKTAPLATPPPRGLQAGEALKYKRLKKSKPPADKARDLSRFDPAAP